MQSPIDPKTSLIQREIEPGLIAYTCPTSGGIWIDHKHYWDWILKQPGFPKPLPAKPAPPVIIENDQDRPLISPESGRIMTKYRVGQGITFRIDHEPSSGGFWLDKGEYQHLRECNLHDEIHLICSPEFQRELANLDSTEFQKNQFESCLGAENCSQIRTLVSKLDTKHSRSVAVAYLNWCMDNDPI